MKFSNFSDILNIFKEAAQILKSNDPLRLGAATSFFTIFALPFILLLLINIFGIIFTNEIISGELFSHLRNIIGTNSAAQVQEILENFQDRDQSLLLNIVGFIFFIFVSTTLFMVVQNSINQIWKIKHKARHKVTRVLKDRAISLGLIIISGVLFLIALLSDALVAFLGDYLHQIFPGVDILIVKGLNKVFSILLVSTWLAIIFRYLPNARLSWKLVWRGAIVTGILFSIGESILGRILFQSDIGSLYGAAGSILLIFLFVFYTSFILYFGASFIQAYAHQSKHEIKPKSYAAKYRIEELE